MGSGRGYLAGALGWCRRAGLASASGWRGRCAMTKLSNEPPLPEPLAYFLTWATYGTWLPGDEPGWVEYRHGWQPPDPIRKLEAEARMTEDACFLDPEQRRLAEQTVADH